MTSGSPARRWGAPAIGAIVSVACDPMRSVSSIRRFGRLTRTLAAASLTVAVALGVSGLAATPAYAAPPLPAEFDLSLYAPVNPAPFQSLAYGDNGRSFFTTGRWNCQIGPRPGHVGCQGAPATAPAPTTFSRTLGAAITADQQGPWWVRTDFLYTPSYHFGSTTGFRPPVLRVGQSLTAAGVTCTVPRGDEVACRTGGRALIFTPGWHKFYWPAWDQKAHSANPAPQYLPPRLRGSNQLP